MGIGHTPTIGLATALMLIPSAIATAQPRTEERPVLHPAPGGTVAPRPPNSLRPDQNSEWVQDNIKRSQDYLAVAKADLAHGQQYMRKVSQEIMSLASQLEALGAEVDQNSTYFNAPGYTRLSRKDMQDLFEGMKKRHQLAIEESDKWLAPLIESMDLTVNQRPNRPVNMIREIDNLEYSIISSMQLSASLLWDLYAWHANWERLVFQAQISASRERMESKYRDENDAAWAVHISEVWKNGYESSQDTALTTRSYNEFAAKAGQACRRANEEDLAYFPQVAASLQQMVVRLRKTFHHVFDDFRRATDQIFVDKSGAKAECEKKSNLWLQETLKVQRAAHSFPPVVLTRMSGDVFFPHISVPVNPAALACGCLGEPIEGIMPETLEAGFPPLTVAWDPVSGPGSSWVFSYDFDRGEKVAQELTSGTAQGMKEGDDP